MSRSFKGFLYWFVVIVCTVDTLAAAGNYAFSRVMLVHDPERLYAIADASHEWRYLRIVLGFVWIVIVAAIVARRYRLPFWRSVVGYLVGLTIVFLLNVPLYFGTSFFSGNSTPAGQFMMIVVFIAYGFACSVAIVTARRRSRRQRLRERAVIDVF